jgi:hypothetical protein
MIERLPILPNSAADAGLPETWVEIKIMEGRLAAVFTAVGEPGECRMTERDDPLFEEEALELFIAPGPEDPKEYFEFEVNPLGALWDGRVLSPGLARDADWRSDPDWNCRGISWGARPTDDGWMAKIAFDLSELSAPLPADWRFNAYRIHRPLHGGCLLGAAFPTGEPNFHCPRKFGRLKVL